MIERIVERFAKRYCESNATSSSPSESPSFLASPGLSPLLASLPSPPSSHLLIAEAAFILSYSIIMLATDLHNANVKTKMTREQWIKNNQGCNQPHGDFDPAFLKKIYERIAKAPFASTSTAKPAVQKEPSSQVCFSPSLYLSLSLSLSLSFLL